MTSTVKTFTIADVAKELKIAPKAARRRLRDYDGKALPQSVHHRAWVWPVSARPAIRAALKVA